MKEQKIVIEIIDYHNPPKIFVDGEEVKVISLDYQYETKTKNDQGEHKLNLVMPDMVNGSFQTKGIAFGK